MIQIQLPSGCYLLVEVPEEAKDFVIDDELFYKAFYMGLENIAHMKKLPSGQWSIIGKASDLKEDDWKGIVEQEFQTEENDVTYCLGWVHYQDICQYLDTATESLLSLIASHNMKPETTLILKKIQP